MINPSFSLLRDAYIIFLHLMLVQILSYASIMQILLALLGYCHGAG